MSDTEPGIFTIGHSNRTLDDFLALLRTHAIARVLDVRRYPVSRRHPHFDAEPLAESLAGAGIGYTAMPELGGRRSPRKDSRNLAWRNAQFRGYADYMETPEFEAALGEVLALGGRERVALMCAEAVPWQCHRSLIADAIVARGEPVGDIVGESAARAHKLPAHARVEQNRVFYPADELPLEESPPEAAPPRKARLRASDK